MSAIPSEQTVLGKVHGFLHKAQALLGIDDKTLGEVLNVRPEEVQAVISSDKLLSVSQLFNVLSFFNIPLERVLSDSVDFNLLQAHFRGTVCELPERYLVGANGRKRSVINILRWLARNYGERELEIVLKQFQLTMAHFANPDDAINNRFLVDLLSKLEELSYDQNNFLRMGEESYAANRDNHLGQLQAQARSGKELIERMFTEHIKHYDTNFSYQIHRLTDCEAVIKFKQDQNVADALGTKHLGSMNANIMKMGVVKSLPRYIGAPDFDVEIPKSVHLGDSYCAYRISYTNTKHLRLVH